MHVELKPELEEAIAQAIRAGVIRDADEALNITLEVLRKRLSKNDLPHNAPSSKRRAEGRKSLAQLFAESPFRGLDLDFERDADTGRPIDFSRLG